MNDLENRKEIKKQKKKKILNQLEAEQESREWLTESKKEGTEKNLDPLPRELL